MSLLEQFNIQELNVLVHVAKRIYDAQLTIHEPLDPKAYEGIVALQDLDGIFKHKYSGGATNDPQSGHSPSGPWRRFHGSSDVGP